MLVCICGLRCEDKGDAGLVFFPCLKFSSFLVCKLLQEATVKKEMGSI